MWAAFAIDYLVRLYLHPHRWHFFLTHLLDLVMVLLPMLRLLRVGLLLVKAFKSVSTEQIAGSLIGIVAVIFVVAALLEWKVEHDAPGANITTIGLAFWWAIVTTTTVGYGDTYPVTVVGRFIGSAGDDRRHRPDRHRVRDHRGLVRRAQEAAGAGQGPEGGIGTRAAREAPGALPDGDARRPPDELPEATLDRTVAASDQPAGLARRAAGTAASTAGRVDHRAFRLEGP